MGQKQTWGRCDGCPLYPQKRSLCAKSGHSALRQRLTLFDHLVSEREQVRRHCEAKRLRGSEIDGQLDFDRELDGKLARFRAPQDAIGIDRCAPIIIDQIIAIRSPARPRNRHGKKFAGKFWPPGEKLRNVMSASKAKREHRPPKTKRRQSIPARKSVILPERGA